MTELRHTKDEYLNCGFDPFDGDFDVNLRAETTKIVKCRKSHVCNSGCENPIESGDVALCVNGVDDEGFVSVYVCIPCLDAWIDEQEG